VWARLEPLIPAQAGGEAAVAVSGLGELWHPPDDPATLP